MAEANADINKKILEFEKGKTVMEQGEKAQGLYILLSGELEVFFENVKVATIDQKGSFVGEIASLLGGRRSATVKAATPVKMMYIKKVTEYLQNNPSSSLMLAQALASRITALNKKFSHFEKVAQNWLNIARDAVEKQDVGPIGDALEDMQKTFNREVRAG